MSDTPLPTESSVVAGNSINDELVDKSFLTSSFESADQQTQSSTFFVGKLVEALCDRFELDRIQVYLGLVLVSLLLFNIILIYSTWKSYSVVILSFSTTEREKKERERANKDKEHSSTNSKSGVKTVNERSSHLEPKTAEAEEMDAFKKFLKNKKVDKHFKRTGEGARLSDGPSDPSQRPSAVLGTAQGGSGGGVDRVMASDIAAQAALKRLYKEEPKISSSQKKIQMIAQRELEEERRAALEAGALSKAEVDAEMKKLGFSTPHQHQPDIREFEHSDVIKGVFYTSELLGEDVSLTKQELQNVIEEFLVEQLKDLSGQDRVVPSVLMIYSLNKKDARERAVETIGKYIQNIVENPDETKYRRIRLSNKAFQERVQSVKGGHEFLLAVGFEESMEPLKEGDTLEPFLVMNEQKASDIPLLVQCLETLREGQSVPVRVSRDTKIFVLRDNERVPLPKLSDDFFDLTADEARKMQEARTEEINKMTSLRTREMRERDELQRKYKYKYTLIRVRFPDRFVLQGTFGCYESLSSLRQWVYSHVAHQATPFVLRDPVSGTILDNDSQILSDLHLVPAAVVHFDWEERVEGCSLNEEYQQMAVLFTNQ